MAADHYVGFDVTELDFTLTDGTTQVEGADLATAKHMAGDSDLAVGSAIDGYSTTGFAEELATALTSAWGTTTVSFNRTLMQYEIGSLSSGTTYTLSQDAANLLGFSLTSLSGSTSYTSDQTPYYMIRPNMDQVSRPSHLYEAGSQASQAVSDDGDAYGIARTTAVTEEAWEVEFDSLAATFADEAASGTPWTWQHLFQHARTVYPVALVTNLTGPVGIFGFLKPEFSALTRNVCERHVESFDDYWRIRIEIIRAGSL